MRKNLFPKLNKDIMLRYEPFGGIVLNKENGRLEVINQTAMNILALCTGRNSIHKIGCKLCEEYDIGKGEVYSHIERFISLAEKKEHAKVYSHQTIKPTKLNITGRKDLFTPIEAIVELTKRCNSRCIYCFADAGKPLSEELNGENWLKTLKLLKNIGIIRLCITGGNPLLHPDIKEILNFCSRNFIFTLLTDGHNISDDFAMFLSKIKPREIQVSLDSHNPEINDKLRGQNTFIRAITTIKKLRKYGLNVSVAATVTSLNYNDISQTVTFARELGASSFDLGPMSRLGRANKLEDNWFIPEEKAAILKRKLIDRFGNFIGRVEQNDHLFGKEEKDKFSFCSELYYRSVSINPQGRVKPCILKSEFVFKQCSKELITNPLVNINKKSFLKHDLFQECRNIRGKIPSRINCGNCKYISICQDCVIIGFYMSKKNPNCKIKFWKERGD